MGTIDAMLRDLHVLPNRLIDEKRDRRETADARIDALLGAMNRQPHTVAVAEVPSVIHIKENGDM